jgi:GR25 family glycosyltransferase involved in LPS biosynthesis
LKAFIIHLPNQEFSNAHATTMRNELREFGFDTELFEGTPGEQAEIEYQETERKLWPYSIKGVQLTQQEVEQSIGHLLPADYFVEHDVKIARKIKWSDDWIGKVSRPGVKGCFDSHYRLWRRCIDLDEPIAIFEDDVKFFRGYKPVDFDDVLIVSIGKMAWKEEPYKTYLETPASTPRPMAWRNYSMPGTSGYIIMPHACRALVKTYRDWYLPADNAINRALVNIQIHNYLMGRHMHESEGNVSAI